MPKKEIKVNVTSTPNALVTIVGRDMGAISAPHVESIFDFSSDEAKRLLQEARANGRFVPFLADEAKIKSLILMTSGKVYPSSFRVVTLMERIRNATDKVEQLQQDSVSL